MNTLTGVSARIITGKINGMFLYNWRRLRAENVGEHSGKLLPRMI